MTKKKTIEEIKPAIELGNEYELLSDEYIEAHSKLEILHKSCGYVFWMSWANFSQNKRCPKCKGKFKLLIENVKITIESFDGYKLLSKEYINSRTKLEILHKSCGHVFNMTWDNFKKGERCPKCRYKNITGENHYSWNPDLTDEEREQCRNYPENKKWIKSVFNRDDYTCQLCNVRGYKLEAHHINSYKEFKDDRFNVDNGVTLCETCHDSYHYEFKPYMVDHHSFYHWMVLNSVIKPENWLWTVQYPKSMNGWLKAYKRAS